MLYESYQDLIGNTPLVRINRFPIPDGVKLYAKLELANPGGSVKDRIGVSMIEDAERRGVLKPGGTIIEGTAGNTGIGIAFAALGRGYRIVFVVPDKFSGEKVALLKALGAEIVRTPRSGGMLLAERRADELAKEIPGAVVLGQFHNATNPRAHYETTGPEIWRDLEGQVDAFVAGAGSGGTFSGVARALKERDSGIRTILADPVGSTLGGGELPVAGVAADLREVERAGAAEVRRGLSRLELRGVDVADRDEADVLAVSVAAGVVVADAAEADERAGQFLHVGGGLATRVRRAREAGRARRWFHFRRGAPRRRLRPGPPWRRPRRRRRRR